MFGKIPFFAQLNIFEFWQCITFFQYCCDPFESLNGEVCVKQWKGSLPVFIQDNGILIQQSSVAALLSVFCSLCVLQLYYHCGGCYMLVFFTYLHTDTVSYPFKARGTSLSSKCIYAILLLLQKPSTQLRRRLSALIRPLPPFMGPLLLGLALNKARKQRSHCSRLETGPLNARSYLIHAAAAKTRDDIHKLLKQEEVFKRTEKKFQVWPWRPQGY